MNLTRTIVNGILRALLRTAIRVDDADLAKLPAEGPLIAALNHINFLDAPLMFTHCGSRHIAALAKTETWDNPLFAFLFNVWEGIPINRGTNDRRAFDLSLKALADRKILAIAPEGTRSGTGQLGQGHAGILPLALRSGAPIIPVAIYGTEKFWENIKRLRRTDFHIVVGNPFRLVSDDRVMGRDEREQMISEIMYQLAALLPPSYRGYYADLSKATETYVKFEPGIESNLRRAGVVPPPPPPAPAALPRIPLPQPPEN
ncbi:MAG TPA: lysophospholipid acyltransferase family protein [Anaerolineaceae bacterium]|nr:lysophospholipid acyltransferase family protein [Anaerolineaceae bacterium]HPN51623.1 lysophospholipid acyltransferase family protein [Anaerolineaceae bacterium]